MANDAGPEAKQWALAATAILTVLTRPQPRHDLLGGAPKSPEGEGVARTILASSWQIDGRDKLVSILDWLGSGGSTADYQKAAAAFAQAPPAARQQDPGLAFVNQYNIEIGNRGLVAWDLGRLLGIAGWGYLAGYCSEDEAWGAAFSAGVRIRGTYGSWEEYAKHYRLGALFADRGSVGQIDQIITQLTSAPDSPWRRTSWSLDGPSATGATSPAGYGAVPAAPGVVPVIAAPGAPAGGAPAAGPPAAYSGVPIIAPPPGQPGAPASYGGVPVIAPPPGGAQMMAPPGAPPGAMGMPGDPSGIPAAGASKKKLFIALGIGGGLLLILILVLVLRHRSHEHEHGAAPAQHEKKEEKKEEKKKH